MSCAPRKAGKKTCFGSQTCWHVRSRQNIERVKRDEAQAAEENRQKQERLSLAEQEARTTLLRRKAHQLTTTPETVGYQLSSDTNHTECLAVQNTDDLDIRSKHVDLFSHLSTEKPKGEKNKEHEHEEKAAKEKYERSVGVLTYLGQSSVEAQTTKPWYFKIPDRADTTLSEFKEQSCIDMKRKNSLDPLMEMEKYVGGKRSKGDTLTPTTESTLKDKTRKKVPSHNSVSVSVRTDCKLDLKDPIRKPSTEDKRRTHHGHKGKHNKHKHVVKKKTKRAKEKRTERHQDRSGNKRKHKHNDDRDEIRDEHLRPSIQQLRDERLKREAAERAKMNQLLSREKVDGGGCEESKNIERPGVYNSQFHPQLARNRHKRTHYNGI